MGERPVHVRQFDQKAVSLKEELARVCPELEEMQERKSERRNQFIEVQEQIQSITNEIYSPSITASVDETDLSLRKLEEFQTAFCISKGEVSGIHPSLGNSEGPRSVNNDTINQLPIAIQDLQKVKLQRMQRLQDPASTMLELWNLMDTPLEEQRMFQNFTCNIAAS
ncbi:65-kDa microtubule-associated protein 3 [Glycine max]|nr:65-kDa microtubule-associated protein 3 [Glycine max]